MKTIKSQWGVSLFKSIDVIGILGRRGCGKSFLAKKIQNVFPRQLIFDTLYEYESDEVDTFFTFEEFGEWFRHSNNQSSFRKVFRFDVDSSNESAVFNEVVRCCYHRGSMTLIIEEIQNFSTPHFLPPFLKQALLTGRHRDLSIIFTTQRPGTLHKTILSQCTHLFTGQLHDMNDLRYVSSFLGQEANTLAELRDREFIYWQPGVGSRRVTNDLRASDLEIT